MFKPYGDRVAIRVDEEAELKDKFNMSLPTSAVENPQTGIVVSVGDGVAQAGWLWMRHLKPEPKVGDRILFSKHGGRKIKIDGEDLLILHESEILGRA